MSFLKELAELSKPAPALPDLEDDDYDGTSSKALKSSKPAEDGEAEAPMRRRIMGLNLNSDSKYGGEKVSRSAIFGDSSEMTGFTAGDGSDDEESLDDEENILDQSDADDQENASDGDSGEEEDGGESSDGSISASEVNRVLAGEDSLGEEASDDDDQSGSEVDSAESDVDDAMNENDDESGENDQEDGEEKTTMGELVSKVDAEKEQKKAAAIRAQMQVWDQLLYIKIKLQAATRAYNQLPRGELYTELMKTADDETKKNIHTARKNAQRMISILLEAEHLLLASSPLTKGIVGEKGGKRDSDDEEIESSEDEKDDEEDGDDAGGAKEGVIDDDMMDEEDDYGDEDDDAEENGEGEVKSEKHLNWKTANQRLESNETRFKQFRESTLRKWDERTRVTASRNTKDAKKDFSAFEKGGVIQQINKIMADKSRLVKRSTTKRSDSERIGGNVESTEDMEIFDDDDFYQVLLREMMERKSNAASDSITMTRHYIEMQNLLKQRKNKKVRNMTSKDRMCKYVTIPKLVNFHPARPEQIEWSHESRNELFKSLFK